MPTTIIEAIGNDAYTTVLHRYTSTSVFGSGHTAQISAGTGRNGTASLKLHNDNGNTEGIKVYKTLPTTYGTLWTGWSYEIDVMPAPTTSVGIFEYVDTGNVQVQVRLFSDGTIRIYRGDILAAGVFLATVPSFSMLAAVKYHFSFKTLVSATVGQITFSINEVLLLDTGAVINTKGFSGSALMSQIVLGGFNSGNAGNTNHHYDDIAVSNDGQILDWSVREDLPTGTTPTDQWSVTGAATTREAVDDNPPDEDTSHANTTVIGNKSIWTYPPVPTTANIHALGGMPRLKKTDSGTALCCSVFRDAAGADHDGANKAPSQDAYEYHPFFWQDTDLTLTPTELNDADSGLGIKRTTG